MALALGISGILSVSQFILLIWLRVGDIITTGKALYAYSLGLLAGCAAAIITKSLYPILYGLVISDVVLTALLFSAFCKGSASKSVRSALEIFVVTAIVCVCGSVAGWRLWMGERQTPLSMDRLDIAALHFGAAWAIALAIGAVLLCFTIRPLTRILKIKDTAPPAPPEPLAHDTI